MAPTNRCSYTCLKNEASLKIKKIANKDEINIIKTWMDESIKFENKLRIVKPNPNSGSEPPIL